MSFMVMPLRVSRKEISRGILKTLPNDYDGAFCVKIVNVFHMLFLPKN